MSMLFQSTSAGSTSRPAYLTRKIVALEHGGVPAAAAEPRGLLAEIGPDLLDLDRGRHVPKRTEHDLLHLFGEDRRLLVGLADHDARGVHRLAVIDDPRSMNSGMLTFT